MKLPKVRPEDIETIISNGGIVYDIEEHDNGYRVRRTRADYVGYLPPSSADFESYPSKVHILPQSEHLFWTNVNTVSGST